MIFVLNKYNTFIYEKSILNNSLNQNAFQYQIKISITISDEKYELYFANNRGLSVYKFLSLK